MVLFGNSEEDKKETPRGFYYVDEEVLKETLEKKQAEREEV